MFHSKELEFAMVSDLDEYSYDMDLELWKSYFKRGTLIRHHSSGNYTLRWGKVSILTSTTATKNRSMELSELVRYNNLLLGFCDYTGMIYKINPQDNKIFLRYAIADGNGNHPKAFKSEWATVKDGVLWVGSFGSPWIDTATNETLHHNPMWVKTINSNGRIENYNWIPVYKALKTAAGCTTNGYLWHEAVHWDSIHRCWIILPRKASVDDMYSVKGDETRGSNILLIASEDFTTIDVKTVGPLEREWGFSSVRKLPGTNDTYTALKVKEVNGETKTKLTVFNLRGDILVDSIFIDVNDEIKYEGIEFLSVVG